jgi:hypothetical protein
MIEKDHLEFIIFIFIGLLTFIIFFIFIFFGITEIIIRATIVNILLIFGLYNVHKYMKD